MRRRLWVWISPGDLREDAALLGALAAHRPGDRFEVFGSVPGAPRDLGLELPNISRRGVLRGIASADFSRHDGFIFASVMKGISKIVLEMSQHAIPMVLADGGDLRDTLDDSGAVFVQNTGTAANTSAAFAAALDHVANLSGAQITAMARTALEQVMARHAPASHARLAAQLFGLS